MRILITNPDSIGDFILRQPMFDALLNEGHQLLLALRSFVSPLAPMMVPRAKVTHCPLNPYSLRGDHDLGTLEPLISSVREFQPELIAVAPYQRTWLDEYLVECFPGVSTVGLSGHLYRGHITEGIDEKSETSFSDTVTVSTDDPELRKNELLCSAILGKNVRLPSPAMTAGETAVRQARSRLQQLGLESGNYWIACVGHSGWNVVRSWGAQEWAESLRTLVERCGLRFLFVGTPDESDVTEQVRARMGVAGEKTASLCYSTEGLDLLAGLTAECAGYIGKDTGPMHLAAALSKPVVSLFGGGDWPRFVPAAQTGAALTVQVPCAGCRWICHLPESHCVKRIPVESVVSEMETILDGQDGFRVCEFKPDPLLANRMSREAAESAREFTRLSNRRIRELNSQIHDLERSLAAERDENRERAQSLEDQIHELKGRIMEFESNHAVLLNEHTHAQAKLDAIRRSVFSRTLSSLGIWKVFR